MQTIKAWLFIAGLGLVFAFMLWLQFFAPCSWVGWMSAKDLPGRCLPGAR